MAQPTNTFDSYDAVGIREDLFDKIFNVDPDETPLLSAIPKVSASNTLHEWQTDGLDAPSATNAHIEGDDTTAGAVTATTRLGNYTQIFKKAVTIPGTLESTDRAGRGREQAYQAMLKGKAMKTDMESSLFANNARVAGNSTTARELAGLPVWLTSNTDAGTSGADATGDGTDARTDGTQRAFTESQLKTVLASVWDNSGKKPDCVYAGSFNKQALSAFTGGATKYDKTEDKRLYASIEVYEYDFGMIKAMPSRHVRSRDAIVVCSDMLAWAQLRPMKQEALAKTGDADKFHIVSEATLVVRNEKAHGGVFDLSVFVTPRGFDANGSALRGRPSLVMEISHGPRKP